MSDQLTDLLRKRFTGHEMNVPPGAWEHVSGQLAAHASGESLRESLQDKFQGHQMEVDPSAWANISGQLGHEAAVGSSFNTYWIAAGVVAVAVTATVLFWNSGTTDHKPVDIEKPAVVVVGTPAPVSVPAANLPLPSARGSIRNEQPVHAPEKAAISMIRKNEQSQVTSAPVPEPTLKAVAAPVQAITTATTPKAEQKPVMGQPLAVAPAIPAAQQEAAVGMKTGTDTPDASPDDDQEGTSSPVTDQTDRSEDDPSLSTTNKDIFIPNVFSPQGDGVNDKLKIVASDYEKVEVRVFAAKGGALVFRSNDLSNMWDGRLPNGNIAEEGYYKCVVLLTDADGQLHPKSEVVRLFR